MLVAQVRPACTLLASLSIITGAFDPLAMTIALGQLFPDQTTGSLVRDAGGAVRGSLLIGQPFTAPEWFHGRPSATGSLPYDPTASGGSNLGPTNPALATLVRERAAALRVENRGSSGPLPVDLVTASGSGLDPHISPAAARLQVARVAAARGLPEAAVEKVVATHVEPPMFGIFGRLRINVLRLNLALGALQGPEGADRSP
jgi:K+-transporting ATPase ATPase C chain